MPECSEHGPYYEYHGRCPHRHCGDDRPDADHEDCVGGSYDGDTLVHTGRGNVSVDPCIAGVVAALNDGGIATSASCCGHGRAHGGVLLSDGRWLVVVTDRALALSLQEAPAQGLMTAEVSEHEISENSDPDSLSESEVAAEIPTGAREALDKILPCKHCGKDRFDFCHDPVVKDREVHVYEPVVEFTPADFEPREDHIAYRKSERGGLPAGRVTSLAGKEAPMRLCPQCLGDSSGCGECGGTGAVKVSKDLCPVCEGSGENLVHPDDPSAGPCPLCDGSGAVKNSDPDSLSESEVAAEISVRAGAIAKVCRDHDAAVTAGDVEACATAHREFMDLVGLPSIVMADADKVHTCSSGDNAEMLSYAPMNKRLVWRLAVNTGPKRDGFVNQVEVNFCPWCGDQLQERNDRHGECGRSYDSGSSASVCLRRRGHKGVHYPQGTPDTGDEVSWAKEAARLDSK